MKINKLFLIQLLILAICGNAVCQVVKKDIDYNDFQNSIVRTYRDSVTITFQWTGQGGVFTYEKEGLVLVKKAFMFPGARVYDFEILEDSVFFCGANYTPSYPSGFAGSFNIFDLFFGSGHINYFNMPCLNLYPMCNKLTIPWRMDVFKYNGIIHLAIVGLEDIDATNGAFTVTTISDVYRTGNIWHQRLKYNKYDVAFFTDIAVVRSHIVAVARGAHGNACYIKIFERGTDFLSNPVTPGYMVEVIDDTAKGDVYISSISDNRFAITQNYYSSSSAGSTVKIFDITNSSPYYLSPVISIKLTQAPHLPTLTTWGVRDIRYNAAVNSLMVLDDMDLPLFTYINRVVLEYDVSNIYSPLLSVSDPIDIYLHSIDKYRSDGFVASGRNTDNHLSLYKRAFGYFSFCDSHTAQLSLHSSNATLSLVQFDEMTYYNDNIPNTEDYLTTKENTPEYRCFDAKTERSDR